MREREHACMSELERSRIQREGQDRKKERWNVLKQAAAEREASDATR